jgi:hypothetical protein
VPGAFLAKIGKTIAESLQRLKSGSQELFSNAQKLGPLRWVVAGVDVRGRLIESADGDMC